MLYSEGSNFDVVKLSCKGQKKPESIPVSFNRMLTDSFDVEEILIEELTNAGG
jgi:hypothetical protein